MLECIDITYTQRAWTSQALLSRSQNSINSKAAISWDLVAIASLINSALSVSQQQSGFFFFPSSAVMNLNVMNERRFVRVTDAVSSYVFFSSFIFVMGKIAMQSTRLFTLNHLPHHLKRERVNVWHLECRRAEDKVVASATLRHAYSFPLCSYCKSFAARGEQFSMRVMKPLSWKLRPGPSPRHGGTGRYRLGKSSLCMKRKLRKKVKILKIICIKEQVMQKSKTGF